MVKCLRHDLGKRLSGCAPYPGRAELVVLGRPQAAGAKKPGFNSPPRGGRVYNVNRWKPKKEIPVKFEIYMKLTPARLGEVKVQCHLLDW